MNVSPVSTTSMLTNDVITWHSPYRLTEIKKDNVPGAKRETYSVQVRFAKKGYNQTKLRPTNEVTLDTFVIATGLTYKAAKRMRDTVDEACSTAYGQGYSSARRTLKGG